MIRWSASSRGMNGRRWTDAGTGGGSFVFGLLLAGFFVLMLTEYANYPPKASSPPNCEGPARPLSRTRYPCRLGAMAPADEVLKSLSRTRRPLYQAPSISRVGAPKFALPQRSARPELVVS